MVGNSTRSRSSRASPSGSLPLAPTCSATPAITTNFSAVSTRSQAAHSASTGDASCRSSCSGSASSVGSPSASPSASPSTGSSAGAVAQGGAPPPPGAASEAGVAALGAPSRGCSSNIRKTSSHAAQCQPFFFAESTTPGCSGQVGSVMVVLSMACGPRAAVPGVRPPTEVGRSNGNQLRYRCPPPPAPVGLPLRPSPGERGRP
jgi:hypothetical protein